MGALRKFVRNFWNDESAQGTAEYVLLLVVIVALVIAFRRQISGAFNDKLGTLSSEISGFKGDDR